MVARNTKHKPVIGLLGGIGSGKSLVARQLTVLGCAVIDADVLAKNALDQPEVQKKIVEWWGTGVLGANGRVDRRAVGEIVFHQPPQLARLEALVHPVVLAERARLRQRYHHDSAVAAIVEDTPLLLEKNLEGDCDVLVYVDASPENRLARVAAKRGWDAQELARRQNQQLPLDIKSKRADYYIDNNADETHCLEQVRRVLSQILTKEQLA